MSASMITDDGARLFCSFRAESRLYGIDAAQVREISTQAVFTPVPQAPPAVRGLANLRSHIHLVIDIRPVLGLAPVACTEESRLVVLKPHLAESLGILVEQGGDIIRVLSSQIEDVLPQTVKELDEDGARSTAVIVGVCKLDGELMNIVGAARLVESVEALMRWGTDFKRTKTSNSDYSLGETLP